jgi:phosphoribosyl-dephospho-CoA transferase
MTLKDLAAIRAKDAATEAARRKGYERAKRRGMLCDDEESRCTGHKYNVHEVLKDVRAHGHLSERRCGKWEKTYGAGHAREWCRVDAGVTDAP